MLTVVLARRIGDGGYSEEVHELHVGEKEKFNAVREQMPFIVSVQASNDELSHIFNTFTMNWRKDARVITWFGDEAKFIIANW